jgi:CheY-like chemotaxis protein
VGERSDEHSELFASVLTKPVKQAILYKHIVAQLTKNQKGLAEEPEVKKKLSVDFAKQYPLHILIAEDNLTNQKLADRVLSKLGYVTEKVLNGREAVDGQHLHHYDIILMDIQMPEMDGLEATRTIRLQTGPQPVIIAMTANAMQGDRETCLQAGMDDYISKPIKLEELLKLLEKWATKKTVHKKIA